MSDKEFQYLTSLGYAGTLADKRNAYYNDLILNGGQPDIPIVAEYAPNRELWGLFTVAVVSQQLQLTYFTARNTETINNVTVYSGNTAAGATPTRCQVGVYSVDPTTEDLTLLAVTNNDTAMFASTFTAYQRALGSSWGKIAGRRYAAATLVVSVAVLPTLIGHAPTITAAVDARYADKPRLCAALAGQATIPASIANTSLSASSIRWAYYFTS